MMIRARLARFALALLAAAVTLAGTQAAAATARSARPSWVAAWGLPVNGADTSTLQGETVRVIARPTIGGSRVRIRLSNASGSAPITLGDARVGVAGDGAAISGANVPVSFHGSPSVTIAPGQEVMSDPARLTITALSDLAVTVYVQSNPAGGTGDNELSSYYVAAGDRSSDTAGTGFGPSSMGGYYVTGIDTYTPNDGAIVALGDSITAGYAPPTTMPPVDDEGWPYWLANRLVAAADEGGPRVSVIDMGISGNQVTRNTARYGASAESRLRRDVLDQTGLSGVLTMEGINDIGDSGGSPDGVSGGTDSVPAPALEAGLASIVQRVHRARAWIVMSPLTPAGDPLAPASLYGPEYSSPSGVQERHDVNQWIRGRSRAYVGEFDFDRVLPDPSFPNHILAQYNSGDNLHPNLAGQQAMAASVGLRTLEWLGGSVRDPLTAQ